MNSVIKKPSAWVPIVMSLATILLLIVSFAMHGVVHQADEGVDAHLFQILMFGQVPIVAFFVLKWLPSNPKQTILILSLQILLALLAMAPVFYFKL